MNSKLFAVLEKIDNMIDQLESEMLDAYDARNTRLVNDLAQQIVSLKAFRRILTKG